MTTIRVDNSTISRSKISRVENLKINVQNKAKDNLPLKSQFSPKTKNDSEFPILHRNSSKKLKITKDDKISEDTQEIEFFKNKLDKLPTKRIYFKKYDSEEQNRINKQINKFLNSSDNLENKSPFLTKLKLIRNSSLPFITINAVDMSVIKAIQPIVENKPIILGRNSCYSTITRNLSNSFDNLSFNFNKSSIIKKNFLIDNDKTIGNRESNAKEIQTKNDRLNQSDESELIHFLEDLKESSNDKYTTAESKNSKPSDNEIKNVEQSHDSLLELEHFLLESGLTPIRERKVSSVNHNLNVLRNQNLESENKLVESKNEKINETYTTSMSKKKVTFSDLKTIIKYEKKGDVRVFYLFNDKDVLLKKIVTSIRRNVFKSDKIKSILVRKNIDFAPPKPTPTQISNTTIMTIKKKSSLKNQNVKSKFLDTNNYKKNNPTINKLNLNISNNNISFNQTPKTTKFLNKNINYISQISERKRNMDISLNTSKRSVNTEKTMKRISSVICKKFCGNPTKFYTKMPPVVELEALKLNSTFINNYKSLTESLLNNSVGSTNGKDLMNFLNHDDNALITDPLNFEIGESANVINENNAKDKRKRNSSKTILVKNFFSK